MSCGVPDGCKSERWSLPSSVKGVAVYWMVFTKPRIYAALTKNVCCICVCETNALFILIWNSVIGVLCGYQPNVEMIKCLCFEQEVQVKKSENGVQNLHRSTPKPGRNDLFCSHSDYRNTDTGYYGPFFTKPSRFVDETLEFSLEWLPRAENPVSIRYVITNEFVLQKM